MDDLIDRDRFGEALGQIEAFAKAHPGEEARDEAASLKEEALAQAEERYAELARAAEAAIARKDYPAARAALKPVDAFGLPALAERAKRKLAEIDSREKHAEQWAQWDALKARVARSVEAGNYAAALRALDEATSLPLENAAALVAEEKEAVEKARKEATESAIAAYAVRSDEVWSLFLERRLDEAEKLLNSLWATPTYELAAEHVKADLEAAKLLREFCAAVERGIVARKGKTLMIGEVGGTILDVRDGQVTLKAGEAEFVRRIQQLTTAQAVACAGLGEDAHAKRVLGVVLAAEGRDLSTLEQAQKALEAAGDDPALGVYKEKLAAARRGIAEAAARAAWEKIAPFGDEVLTEERAREAASLLDKFQSECGGTEAFKQAADQVASLRESVTRAIGGPHFTLRVITKTAALGNANPSRLVVEVLLNGSPAYRRRLEQSSREVFEPGAVDRFALGFDGFMPGIKGVRLAVRGRGVWRCEYIVFQFLEGAKKSEPRRFPVSRPLSGAKPALKHGARRAFWFEFAPKLE